MDSLRKGKLKREIEKRKSKGDKIESCNVFKGPTRMPLMSIISRKARARLLVGVLFKEATALPKGPRH
jgi:hypothetical protein